MNKAFKICLDNYDLEEIRGSKHEKKIIAAFKAAKESWIKDDETAWCAAWMCYCFYEASMFYEPTVRARDWGKYGEETTTPKQGDICVLWRVSKISNYGHVGFFIKRDENYVWLLGGNQSNKVCIQKYPISRVLGYRSVAIETNKSAIIEDLKSKIKEKQNLIFSWSESFAEIEKLAKGIVNITQ